MSSYALTSLTVDFRISMIVFEAWDEEEKKYEEVDEDAAEETADGKIEGIKAEEASVSSSFTPSAFFLKPLPPTALITQFIIATRT